ncbi:MAG: redoxin domain-containing protein [Alphaproteobacteria bacterium]|nr:redoxin domain-containing protein [Alphaproteobacteria bacterium]
MIRAPHLILFALALSACTAKGDATDDSSGADDSAATDDTASVERYGPENDWYHAPLADIPEGLEGGSWLRGAVVPNLIMTDQNGDEVWLHQFYGRTVILDAGSGWCQPCHNLAPYVEHFWQEYGEEAVIITALIDDAAGNPAGAQTVADWVDLHASTNPILYLDADSYRSVQQLVGALPHVMVIDPELRVGVRNVYAASDAWIDQLMDRTAFSIDGNVDDDEVCGDGIDNNLDTTADCMEAGCQSDAVCAQTEQTGAIESCAYYRDGGTVDVWRVEVTDTVAEVIADTVAADTVFEPVVLAKRAEDAWDEVSTRHVGDDEIDCTFPAATYSCAQGWLRPGTWDLVVAAGGGNEGDGDCVNAGRGEYVLKVRGAASVTLVEDDVASPTP